MFKTLSLILLVALATGCASTVPQKRRDFAASVCRHNPYCETYTPKQWEQMRLADPTINTN